MIFIKKNVTIITFHTCHKMPKTVREICVQVREKVRESLKTFFQIFVGNPESLCVNHVHCFCVGVFSQVHKTSEISLLKTMNMFSQIITMNVFLFFYAILLLI